MSQPAFTQASEESVVIGRERWTGLPLPFFLRRESGPTGDYVSSAAPFHTPALYAVSTLERFGRYGWQKGQQKGEGNRGFICRPLQNVSLAHSRVPRAVWFSNALWISPALVIPSLSLGCPRSAPKHASTWALPLRPQPCCRHRSSLTPQTKYKGVVIYLPVHLGLLFGKSFV